MRANDTFDNYSQGNALRVSKCKYNLSNNAVFRVFFSFPKSGNKRGNEKEKGDLFTVFTIFRG